MANESATLSRAILPIPDREHVGLTTYDAKDPDAKYPPIEPLRPPKGAPNVLLVLLDDVGFAASSAFGGATSANGVIIAQGGRFNGWSLYATDGRLKYCYNFLGIKLFHAESDKAIPPGQHQLRMEFKYDGGGLAKGGNAVLFLDGANVGEGRVDMTVPMVFSGDETCDVGRGTGLAVTPDYDQRDNEFSGEVNWVHIDLEKDDHYHLISPEERFKVAMARQ